GRTCQCIHRIDGCARSSAHPQSVPTFPPSAKGIPFAADRTPDQISLGFAVTLAPPSHASAATGTTSHRGNILRSGRHTSERYPAGLVDKRPPAYTICATRARLRGSQYPPAG